MARQGAFLAALLLLALAVHEAQPSRRDSRSIDLNELYQFRSKQGPHYDMEAKPLNYKLHLKPDIDKGTFEGQVWINVTLIRPTRKISLMAHTDLTVHMEGGATLYTTPGPKAVNITRLERNTKENRLEVFFDERLQNIADPLEFTLKFHGNISLHDSFGLFRGEYADQINGSVHKYLATSLRMERASSVFPCFDTNLYKVSFELSVLRPRGMMAVSNMRLNSSTDAEDKNFVWDHFQKTPKMSPFQLGLLISDLEKITVKSNGMEISVYGRKNYMDIVKEVPDKGIKIFNYLNDYFDHCFGMDKLDLVALPAYKAPKATDSWGLILFRESDLSSPSYWNLAYEMTYQWIGQYMTTEDWYSAPANKALNSYLATMTTLDINPEEMEGKWPISILYPLYYELGKTYPFSRVASIRSEATSSKLELIFRMYNYTLGKDVFRSAMRQLIRQKQDDNSSAIDESLRTFNQKDVFSKLHDAAKAADKIFPDRDFDQNRWIDRERIPLVTVTRDYQTGNATFEQRVYYREPPPAYKVSYSWDVPIVVISQDDLSFDKTSPLFVMQPGAKDTKAKNVTVRLTAGDNQFVIVNPEEIGMFPVNYDARNWLLLAEFLAGKDRVSIPPLTRAKLIHDSWNLAYAGELSFATALNMTRFLRNERNHVVWEPVFPMIDHIGRRIEGSPIYIKFEAYIQSLLKPLYNELWKDSQPGEPSWKVHMRSLAKNFLCRSGYEPCVTEAREQFAKWISNEEPDNGNPVANEFICPVFQWGTNEEWEFGLNRVINFPKDNLERKPSERTYLLKTLAGCPRDASKVEKLLNVTILNQNDNFTDSDIHLIFSMLMGNSVGYKTLFKYLDSHWSTLKERFDKKPHLWDGLVNAATSPFNTQEGVDMVSKLYNARKGEFDSAHSIIETAMETIKAETKWSEKNLPIIGTWLDVNLCNKDPSSCVDPTKVNTTRNQTPVVG